LIGVPSLAGTWTGGDEIGDTDNLLEFIERGRAGWHRDALCKHFPTLTWFPQPCDDVRTVKAICAACPAFDQCKHWALNADPDLVGIWGGLSEVERREIRTGWTPPGRHRRGVQEPAILTIHGPARWRHHRHPGGPGGILGPK
jgi:hypothetical protein